MKERNLKRWIQSRIYIWRKSKVGENREILKTCREGKKTLDLKRWLGKSSDGSGGDANAGTMLKPKFESD
jgi:hypothetical protein